MATRGKARSRPDRHGRRGSAGQGTAGRGKARQARQRRTRPGTVWLGMAGPATLGLAGPGAARRGQARQARRGSDRHRGARLGRQGCAGRGGARSGLVRHGRHGRPGAARPGKARHGRARRGKARYGTAGKVPRGSGPGGFQQEESTMHVLIVLGFMVAVVVWSLVGLLELIRSRTPARRREEQAEKARHEEEKARWIAEYTALRWSPLGDMSGSIGWVPRGCTKTSVRCLIGIAELQHRYPKAAQDTAAQQGCALPTMQQPGRLNGLRASEERASALPVHPRAHRG